jgi:hypothetical protein
VPVDLDLESVNPADYDALVLPGGQINPDKLRLEPKALEVVRTFLTLDWRDCGLATVTVAPASFSLACGTVSSLSSNPSVATMRILASRISGMASLR